ncbi:hypothetical protein CXB49_22820 [Chromobacterium sp. ATCC 53434]|uniref:hypothetical protein n=1 Tax=Chromobacterium sp. (strain ATCC 53434 / SC 14030) TaxID=2059672 RepID=UPI000C770499|nr:hypothetical protein [Chromobacterium sp. ATCC 53434]AUH53409.1 hypothetical protein CXB49_22820 [Chromobacterium sp. ATCC 53434]
MKTLAASLLALSVGTTAAADASRLAAGLWQIDVTSGDMQSGSGTLCEKAPMTVLEMAAQVVGVPAGAECALSGAVEAPGISRYRCKLKDGLEMETVFFWQRLQADEWTAGSVVKLRPANQEAAALQLRLRRVGECK